MANHAKKTQSQWQQLSDLVAAVDHWEAFFRPLVGQPELATALVKLGLAAVRKEIPFGPETRRKVENALRKHG